MKWIDFQQLKARFGNALPAIRWSFLVFLLGAALQILWDWQTLIAEGGLWTGDSVRGWEGDNLLFSWNLWWVAEAFWSSESISDCRMIFAPEGFRFYFHTNTIISGLEYAIVQAPWRIGILNGDGPSVGLFYNWSGIFSGGLTFLGAYHLAGVFRKSLIPQALAALLVQFCGFHLFSYYGHLNFVQTEWLVFALYFMSLGIRDQSGWKAWTISGFFAALSFWNDITFGIYCVLFWSLTLFWHFAILKRKSLSIFSFLISYLIILLPLLLELFSVFRSGDYVVGSHHQPRISDFTNLILPGDYHSIVGAFLGQWRMEYGIPHSPGDGYLGIAFIAILVTGAYQLIRHRHLPQKLHLLFVFAATTFFVLSLGDRLTIFGHHLIPLPGLLLSKLPITNNLRAPSRYSILVLCMICPLIPVLFGKLKSAKRSGIFALFLIGMIFFDSRMIPISTDLKSERYELTPTLLEELSHIDGSIWTLPNSFEDRLPLWHQTQHHQALVFGAAARVSPQVIENRFGRFDFLRHLKSDQEMETAQSKAIDYSSLEEYFEEFSVEGIISSKELPQDLVDHLKQIGWKKTYHDDFFQVWLITEKSSE